MIFRITYPSDRPARLPFPPHPVPSPLPPDPQPFPLPPQTLLPLAVLVAVAAADSEADSDPAPSPLATYAPSYYSFDHYGDQGGLALNLPWKNEEMGKWANFPIAPFF